MTLNSTQSPQVAPGAIPLVAAEQTVAQRIYARTTAAAEWILRRIPHAAWQWLCLALVLVLYGELLLLSKWRLFPGWTWGGYVTNLRTFGALAAFIAGHAYLMYRLFTPPPDDSWTRRLRSILGSRAVLALFMILLLCCGSMAWALVLLREGDPTDEVRQFIVQSNWSHATARLEDLRSRPVRADIVETLDIYINVHRLSETDDLRLSNSLREQRDRISKLIASDSDLHFFNTLSYAELSKAMYFVEADPALLTDGENKITRTLGKATRDKHRSVLIARLAELSLARKDYARARELFEEANQLETNPTRHARNEANIGNTYVRDDVKRAILAYAGAEPHYPQGRRYIFYSNYAYLLMRDGQFELAEKKVVQAIKIKPDDWYSYINLGIICDELGRHEDAVIHYTLVLEKSEQPIVKLLAKIFLGRSLELGGKPFDEYVKLYLEAANRSTVATQIQRVRAAEHLSALYSLIAERLRGTSNHGMEPYVEWFEGRARDIAKAAATPRP